MERYRIKTLKEMKKEFGENWRRQTGFNNRGMMDYLLGQPLTKEQTRSLLTTDFAHIENDSGENPSGYWIIGKNSVTKAKRRVSYEKSI